jgi:hypothetical protein
VNSNSNSVRRQRIAASALIYYSPKRDRHAGGASGQAVARGGEVLRVSCGVLRLAVSLSAIVVACSVVEDAAAALLRLTPAAGKRGTLVRAVGSGFQANRDGAISLAGDRVARVHTSASGTFSVRFRVPALSRGSKAVVARVRTRKVESVFRITRTQPAQSSSITAHGSGKWVTLTPLSGESGAFFTLRARKFAAGSTLEVLFDGVQLATATAGGKGGANFVDLAVPATDVGRHTIVVRSGSSELPMPFRVLETPGAPCAPISELPCSEVLVPAPYTLSFDSGTGGLDDKDGQGTGFTMFDPKSTGAAYIPANLDLDTSAGTLDVTTTSGLAFQALNSQDNALGVGIDASDGVSRIQATLLDPPAGTNSFEQAGLWFGNDQDNYAKLVVVSTADGPKVQFLAEVAGVQLAAPKTQALTLPADVTLRLDADPDDTKVTASFSTNGATFTSLGSFTVPNTFFSADPTAVDPAIGTDTFAGILTSHRTAAAALTYSFDDFSVTAPCAPLSPLACEDILVAAPYTLDFDSDEGAIVDMAGVGTGFTMVDPPSNGTGYIPANLDMNTGAGTLSISSTAGLAFSTADSQDNALGVGIDSADTMISTVATALLTPPAGTGASEQGGIWFGANEDNYAKVVVISTATGSKVQFLTEIAGAQADQVQQAITLPAAMVELSLRADPSDLSITASYSVDGAGPVQLGPFTVTESFFSTDPGAIDPAVGTNTFGGVFASHRNGTGSLTYAFDGFSLTQEAPAP